MNLTALLLIWMPDCVGNSERLKETFDNGKWNILTASMSVNCSATMMGSNDRKLKAGSSSSKPLSSCVAKGQPMCSPEEIKKNIFFRSPPQAELSLNTVPALLLCQHLIPRPRHCVFESLSWFLSPVGPNCTSITTCELTLCLQLDRLFALGK